MEMYAKDHDGHYPGDLEQLSPKYLKTMPSCPAAGKSTYVGYFGPSAPLNEQQFEDYYLVECKGGGHEEIIRQTDYPKYNPIVGLIER
jgi:hypothetical protein